MVHFRTTFFVVQTFEKLVCLYVDEKSEETIPANQNLLCLRSSFRLEKKVGEKLAGGEIL